MKKAVQALRRALPGRVSTVDADRFSASLDNLRISILPDAVVRARAPEDVGTVLRLASKYRVPVTARGAGSSATGAAVPACAGWALDLSALKGVKIDTVSRIATVGPGITTGQLQARAGRKGLFYPPDPSSKQYSTIGGNIACNAGGMRCVKYGVTRDYVLGLAGYLADGSFVRWGLPLKKFVSGLNLRDLWIGSEGTLGVVTEANLRLIPLPERRWAGMFAFKDDATALRSVTALLKEGIGPSICEFLDRQSVECAEHYTGIPIFRGHSGASLLLVELDGTERQVSDASRLLRALLKPRVLAERIARSEEDAESIWQVRRTCSQSMYSLADTKLNEDVVVPLGRQVELVRYAATLRDEIGLATPTFGHAGDGNLHVHIMYNRGNASEARKAKAGIRKLMRKVVELGGVITGEHGIGLAKAPFMEFQHSKAELRAMKAVKNALDPQGILNPGKIFEPFEVWEHETAQVRLPWDKR